MEDKEKPSSNKQIASLLLLIGSAVGFAVAVSLLLVWHYAPSGLYKAKHVLLSPDFFSELKYSDANPKTGGASTFVFDTVEFTYYDKEHRQWKKVNVPVDAYKRFYNSVADDVSVEAVTPDITDMFRGGYPAVLAVRVKVNSNSDWDASSKNFQEVAFDNKSDYYRVELRENGLQQKWAYFYHPKIYGMAVSMLGEDNNSQ